MGKQKSMTEWARDKWGLLSDFGTKEEFDKFVNAVIAEHERRKRAKVKRGKK